MIDVFRDGLILGSLTIGILGIISHSAWLIVIGFLVFSGLVVWKSIEIYMAFRNNKEEKK
jgi:hypothetical protein